MPVREVATQAGQEGAGTSRRWEALRANTDLGRRLSPTLDRENLKSSPDHNKPSVCGQRAEGRQRSWGRAKVTPEPGIWRPRRGRSCRGKQTASPVSAAGRKEGRAQPPRKEA